MATVYIGIGSNLGNKLANLNTAIQMLEPEVHPFRISSVYQTKPWGFTNQPDFFNCALAAKTQLAPIQFLNKLKSIESEMGRTATVRNGPRVIDLDILIYQDQIIQSGELEIPHPRMVERAFVLVPLSEIAPDLRHPITGLTTRELLLGLDLSGVEKTSYSLRGILE